MPAYAVFSVFEMVGNRGAGREIAPICIDRIGKCRVRVFNGNCGILKKTLGVHFNLFVQIYARV